jgi:hypothetical protein
MGGGQHPPGELACSAALAEELEGFHRLARRAGVDARRSRAVEAVR